MRHTPSLSGARDSDILALFLICNTTIRMFSFASDFDPSASGKNTPKAKSTHALLMLVAANPRASQCALVHCCSSDGFAGPNEMRQRHISVEERFVVQLA